MRVGRGARSGKGRTCGRGTKGQMARAGHKHKPTFEGGQMRLVRRLPKRGFKNPTRVTYIPVNVGRLDRFPDGTEVTVALLHQAGLVKRPEDRIKVLGNGALGRKVAVKAHAFSAAARAKIEEAGGTCEVVG
jgi:large subunit ribosomal protein L15